MSSTPTTGSYHYDLYQISGAFCNITKEAGCPKFELEMGESFAICFSNFDILLWKLIFDIIQ